jgi:hypothetical protein
MNNKRKMKKKESNPMTFWTPSPWKGFLCHLSPTAGSKPPKLPHEIAENTGAWQGSELSALNYQ